MDYSGLVSKMKARGVDCIVITTTAQWTVPLLREMERQAWKPAVIVGHPSGDVDMLARLAGVTATEGIYVTLTALPIDYDDPFMNKYREIFKKYTPDQKMGNYHFGGYGVMSLFLTLLKQVGRDLQREKLIDTLESWKDFETGCFGKFTYGPDDHVGQDGMTLVQVVGGKAKVINPRMYPAP